MRKIIGSLLLLAPAFAFASFDPPDLNYEYQLHRQFLHATGQGVASNPVGLSENYKIQKGETLWSLSQMLYGDGNYWPRVWSQNRELSNPHLVRPGHHLQFLMGSEDDLPAFRFSEDNEPVAGLERTAGPGGQNPIVDIPPPEVPPKPVLKVPSSFPEWQSVYKQRVQKFTDYSGLDYKRMGVANRYFLRAWVQEEPISSIGKYQENDTEAGLPLPNQYVYVKMKKGTGAQGQKYLIVRDFGQLMRMNSAWKGKDKARLIQVSAEVELTEQVAANYRRSRDKEEYDSWRALVTRATGLSAKDCDVISGTLQVIDTDPTSNYGMTNAQIIGSERHEASAVFGPGDLVFLNKGSSQGVEDGQMYNVFSDRTTRNFRAEVPVSPAASGLIKIVQSSMNLATAIVVSSKESIQQGDQVRQASTARSEELDYVNPGGPSATGNDLEEYSSSPDDQPSNLDDEKSLEDEIESGENF
jgi:hypothetical protein